MPGRFQDVVEEASKLEESATRTDMGVDGLRREQGLESSRLDQGLLYETPPERKSWVPWGKKDGSAGEEDTGLLVVEDQLVGTLALTRYAHDTALSSTEWAEQGRDHWRKLVGRLDKLFELKEGATLDELEAQLMKLLEFLQDPAYT